MKFSLRVLDIIGSKPPVEASRGPHHSAVPSLVPRSTAEAFFSGLSPAGSRAGVREALPLPPESDVDAYTVSQGVYTRDDEVQPGEYLLVVSAKAKMPVFQRLTLSERNGVPIARAGWQGVGPAAANLQALSVELPQGSQGARSGESQRSLVVVKLHMPVEFVLVSGTSFWHRLPGGAFDHTDLGAFLEARRNQLFQDQEMLAGYRVTEFDPLDRRRRTWVKAVGDHRAWLLVAETHTDVLSVDYVKDRSAGQANADNINALDVYGYLDSVGKVAPGSIWSVEFLSHSFSGGPILWDTTESEGFRTNQAARDPQDHDPRAKDFNKDLLSKFPTLPAAHLHKAVWRIWGCNVDRSTTRAAVAAHTELGAGLPEHDLFTCIHHAGYEERFTVAHLMDRIARTIRRGYASSVVRGLGRTIGCYAVPPGLGASFGGGMFVTRNRGIVEGTSQGSGNDDLAVSRVYALYRRFLGKDYISAGIERDDGYFEFRWLLEEMLKWPKPVWTPAVYRWKRAAASLIQFACKATATGPHLFGPASITEHKGLVGAGLTGWLFVFLRTAVTSCNTNGDSVLARSDSDLAFFQQDDGALFIMRRSGKDSWAVDTRSIPRTPAEEGAQPAPPMTNGLLVKKRDTFF